MLKVERGEGRAVRIFIYQAMSVGQVWGGGAKVV